MQASKISQAADNQAADNQVALPIIGYHRSALTQKFGMPRQPNLVAMPSHIVLQAPYNNPDAFVGIENFSHLWLTWQAHRNNRAAAAVAADFKPKVRPPRLGGNATMGVFATRSTYRPSQLGLSVVQFSHIELINGGVVLHIVGADMVNNTPIIDIKPYIGYSDAISDAVCGFAPAQPIAKKVQISAAAQRQLQAYSGNIADSLPPEDIQLICQLIAQDPRPAYRQGDSERVFVMRYKQYDVRFNMNADGSMQLLAIVAI